MARNSENIAGAISAVNGIVSAQTEALAQIKTALASKAAGASDISLGLTGAAVGDIVKVKAVDANGKPTEWEAATQETWEKLVDVTLEEAVDSVTYTLVNCKRIKALITPVLASAYNSWKRISVNNTVYPTLASKIEPDMSYYCEIDTEKPVYVACAIAVAHNLSVVGVNGGVRTEGLANIATQSITEFGFHTPEMLTAGTKIEVWGVKS